MNLIKNLQRALRKDEGLYLSYQANIAMSFIDEYIRYQKKNDKKYLNRSDLHIISNEAAKNFLNLLIKE